MEKPRIRKPQMREPRIREPRIREPQIREPWIREPRIREPQVREPRIATLGSRYWYVPIKNEAAFSIGTRRASLSVLFYPYQ